MSGPQTPEVSPSSYIVVLSGTHVTGKETVALSLSSSLDCPWIKGEYAHNSAIVTARLQEKRGIEDSAVFGRLWLTKMKRIGLHCEVPEEGGGGSESEDPNQTDKKCIALVSCFAMRKLSRDAIREVMLKNSVRVIFVVLQITTETLSGRTLGAENTELAETIMASKAEDIREPAEEEIDVLVVDSMQDVDTLTKDIEEIIRRHVATGQ